MDSKQIAALLVDVLGIILVIVGGLITYVHSKSGVGIGLFWVGIVLLIVALIISVLSMGKVNMQKT